MSQTTVAFNGASASWEEHRAAFFSALQNSDIQTLETVMTKYPEAVEWQNKQGERPLHLAFEKRDRDTFMYLLQKGANANQESVVQRPLVFKILLMEGNSSEYILDEAVQKGEKNFIIPLLQYGASEHRARRYRAPKEIRYEISDLLDRADIIRKEFLADQKAQKHAQPTPAKAQSSPSGEQEIEVLKPVKVRNKTAAQTP